LGDLIIIIIRRNGAKTISLQTLFGVDPEVFRFVVKGVKAIFLGIQRGWGLL
jgi:hypothetical protein